MKLASEFVRFFALQLRDVFLGFLEQRGADDFPSFGFSLRHLAEQAVGTEQLVA